MKRIVHKDCRGIVEFDSFGKIKCMKCKELIKEEDIIIEDVK